MARLPSANDLGERPEPQPQSSVARYQPSTGFEGAGARGFQQSAADLGDLARMVAVETEKIDTLKVEDAWNQYKTLAMDLTVGEKGVLNAKGADAVNGNILGQLTTGLSTGRQTIAAGLTQDQQRRFLQRADTTDLQAKHQTMTHVATQVAEYAKTVFTGSEAAARAQVSAMPTDPGVFAGARETLMAQADLYTRASGITDPNVVASYKDKLSDGLWAHRIDALLYSQPMLADAMFRANEREIKSPEVRLVLQAKTREASMSVSASIEAQKVIDETRAAIPPPTRSQQGRATPEGGPALADNLVETVIRQESGGRQTAVSPKGAIGVMQVMPETARQTAAKLGLPYSEARLRTDEAYNRQIGTAYLNEQVTRFGGNQTLALAAYNAGPEMVDDWINGTNNTGKNGRRLRLGDPNTGEISDAAFAARIPFMETRLYVASINRASPPGPMRTVGYNPDDPLVQNTSGMPNSRDIAAQLPIMTTKVSQRADALYGSDQGNPDRAAFIRRMTAELHSKVASDVQAFNAIQRQAQGVLIDAVTGVVPAGSAPGAVLTGGRSAGQVLTSFSQVQANPDLMRAWQLMDPAAKVGIERLMEHNLRANDHGDVRLFRETFNRIHLEDGDPNKINFYQQIVDPRLADRLSMPQINQLRQEIDRNETPGGRSLNQLRKMADANVSMFFKTNIMFTAQPDRQIAATMRWNEDAGKKIDEYVKAGKDVRSLFQLDSQDSIISQAYLQTYVNSTPAQGLAAGAAQARAGAAPAQAAQPPAQPRNQADYDAMPPGTVYLDPTGQARQKPGQAPAVPQTPAGAAPAPPAAAVETPVPTINESGKLVQPVAAAPAALTADAFEVIEKPTTVGENIATLRRARSRAAEIRKLGAVGPQYDVLGPWVSAWRAAWEGGQALGGVLPAVGRAGQRAIPTELEAIYSGFEAIKRNKRVTRADEDILNEVLKFGLLKPEDEALARGLLARLEKK